MYDTSLSKTSKRMSDHTLLFNVGPLLRLVNDGLRLPRKARRLTRLFFKSRTQVHSVLCWVDSIAFGRTTAQSDSVV